MSWIKTNFLWMMYRSGWASKRNQEKVFAVRISRKGFEEILSKALTGKARHNTGKIAKCLLTIVICIQADKRRRMGLKNQMSASSGIRIMTRPELTS